MNSDSNPVETPALSGAPQKPQVTVNGTGFEWTRALILLPFVAMFLLMFTKAGTTSAHAAMDELQHLLQLQGKPVAVSANVLSEHELEQLDKMDPQVQAELLLERSINHYKGANDEIAKRAARWRGDIQLDDKLNGLFMTALNSDDLRVRAAGLEIDIAARNLEKTSAQIDQLEPDARNGEQGPRVNALWNIAVLGNRGVEPDRAENILLASIHDPNDNVRYWAVEGMSVVGTDETVGPLLETLHDDPAPNIRERAACGLAQSGMLSEKQRRMAVPKLIEYAGDQSLDAQTHSWIYQALRDITGQSLPHEAAAWKQWYDSNDGKWNPVTHDEQ